MQQKYQNEKINVNTKIYPYLLVVFVFVLFGVVAFELFEMIHY